MRSSNPLQENQSFPQWLVLFDGICGLCHHFVRLLLKIDRKEKLKFASLQSQIGHHFLQQEGLSSQKLESVLFIKEGKIYQKSTAVLQLLYTLGYPWRLLFVFVIIPQRWRDWMYLWIAEKRYHFFGSKEVCEVFVSPKYSKRFLTKE